MPLYFFSFPQYINKTGFRVCFKELFESKYDPLFITYTVLSGKSFIMLGLEINWFRNSIQLIFYFVDYSLITQLKQIRQNYLVITRFSCIFFPYISNNAISRIKLSPFCTNQKKIKCEKTIDIFLLLYKNKHSRLVKVASGRLPHEFSEQILKNTQFLIVSTLSNSGYIIQNASHSFINLRCSNSLVYTLRWQSWAETNCLLSSTKLVRWINGIPSST